LQADLLVTDISMSKLNGIEAVRQLRSRGLKTPAIVLTIIEDKDIANEALSAGAQGFVVKSRMGSELPLAVREVLAGRTYISEPRRKNASNGHKIAGC
jgi:DNA-binding NarL/FixJ family response regulator